MKCKLPKHQRKENQRDDHFQLNKDYLEPVLINDQHVEVVQNYKYLSTIIDDTLKGNDNIQRI